MYFCANLSKTNLNLGKALVLMHSPTRIFAQEELENLVNLLIGIYIFFFNSP